MTFEEMKEYKNTQSGFVKLTGINITEVREGFAAGEIVIREEHLNVIGIVHGGCTFSLADSVGGSAAMSRGNRVVTVSSDFHYLAPAKDCVKIIAKAREIKSGKSMLLYDLEVEDDKGTLLAKGTFSYFNLGNL